MHPRRSSNPHSRVTSQISWPKVDPSHAATALSNARPVTTCWELRRTRPSMVSVLSGKGVCFSSAVSYMSHGTNCVTDLLKMTLRRWPWPQSTSEQSCLSHFQATPNHMVPSASHQRGNPRSRFFLVTFGPRISKSFRPSLWISCTGSGTLE